MKRDRDRRILDERTARLRQLRLAAEESRKLDLEVAKRAAAPKRPVRRTRFRAAGAIPVDELNAANDK